MSRRSTNNVYYQIEVFGLQFDQSVLRYAAPNIAAAGSCYCMHKRLRGEGGGGGVAWKLILLCAMPSKREVQCSSADGCWLNDVLKHTCCAASSA